MVTYVHVVGNTARNTDDQDDFIESTSWFTFGGEAVSLHLHR